MSLAAYLALDHDTLAELAGAGLLRRALKDLQAARVEARDLAAMHFVADGQQVSLDLRGWQQARCSCPAPGWCKHKLAAILYLQQRSAASGDDGMASIERSGPASGTESVDGSGTSSTDADVSPQAPSTALASDPAIELFAEIDALDYTHVLRLAGTSARRRLPRLLTQITALRWQAYSGSLLIELVGLQREVRYLRHGGYAGMYSEGPTAGRGALHLAALWALWRERGRDLPDPLADLTGIGPAAGSGDLLGSVIDQVQTQLRDWLDDGLAQLSPASLDRLALLAIDARAESMPALSGRLRHLADWGQRLRARDDQVGEDEVLTAVAQCWAWCGAMGAADPQRRASLGGGPRQFVEQRLQRSLLVVGAHWWQRPSGARGLSLLLWDGVEQRLRRCSLARADASDRSFERSAAWSALPLWSGLGSAERLVDGGSVFVSSARLSAGGDLAPGEIDAIPGAAWPVNSECPVGIDDWSRLSGLLASTDLFQPALPYLLLAPSRCLPVQLDELQQCLRWNLVDRQGRILQARWPCPADHEAQLRMLDQLISRRGQWRLLLAYSNEPQPQLQPVSLLLSDRGHWRCHPLQFTQPPKRAPVSALLGRISRMLAERRDPPFSPQHPLLRELLQPLSELLVRCASLGHSSAPDDAELALLSRRLGEAGLELLATSAEDWRQASVRGLDPHDAMLKLVVLLEQGRQMLQWRDIVAGRVGSGAN